MPLQRRFFCRGEINDSLPFIHRTQPRNFPLALCELRQLLSAHIVQIQVAIPASFARPQESLSVLEKVQIVAHVNPVIILVDQNRRALPVPRIRHQQFNLRLLAVHSLNGDAFRIRQPLHSWNVLIRLRSGIHQPRFSSHRACDIHMHDRVISAAHGIPFFFRFARIGFEIHHRIFCHLPLIHLEERHRRTIWRPPVRRRNCQLFRIDPIQLALSNLFRSARRQSVFFPVRRTYRVQIVFPHK